MSECNFSWFKILFFFGTAILAVLCFIMFGLGVSNIVGGETTYGVACILAGVLSAGVAAWVYNNYKKNDNK